MSPCYYVHVTGPDGHAVNGTFQTPGTALAYLERQRARYGPRYEFGVYDADRPELGDCEEDLSGAACVRWGQGADRCVLAYDHVGPCADYDGNTTLTLAAQYLGREVQ